MTAPAPDPQHDGPLVGTVVVPLDGSPRAEAALPIAAALAQQTGTPLVLVSVADEQQRDERMHSLRDAQERIGAADVQVAIDAHDRPAAPILDLVCAMTAPLLCLSSHGRTGLANVLIGSTAAALVAGSERPVMVVGPKCRPTWPAASRLMLVPLDGSTRANRIIPLAIRASKELSLEPSLLHVAHPLDAETAHDPGATLEAAAAAFAEAGVPVVENVLFEHPAAEYVASYAERMGATLVVMSSQLRTGVQRLTHQSVAMATVHRAPCPVLVQNA